MHTNKDAEDFKILKSPNSKINEWQDFVPAKKWNFDRWINFFKKMDN